MRNLIASRSQYAESFQSAFRDLYGGTEDKFQRDYIQLWLYSMRHFPDLSDTAASQPRKESGRPKPKRKAPVQSRVDSFAQFARSLGFSILKLETDGRCGNVPDVTPATRKPLLSTDLVELQSKARCNRPFDRSFNTDRKYLFIDTIVTEPSIDQEQYITTFAVARDIVHSFWDVEACCWSGRRHSHQRIFNLQPEDIVGATQQPQTVDSHEFSTSREVDFGAIANVFTAGQDRTTTVVQNAETMPETTGHTLPPTADETTQKESTDVAMIGPPLEREEAVQQTGKRARSQKPDNPSQPTLALAITGRENVLTGLVQQLTIESPWQWGVFVEDQQKAMVSELNGDAGWSQLVRILEEEFTNELYLRLYQPKQVHTMPLFTGERYRAAWLSLRDSRPPRILILSKKRVIKASREQRWNQVSIVLAGANHDLQWERTGVHTCRRVILKKDSIEKEVFTVDEARKAVYRCSASGDKTDVHVEFNTSRALEFKCNRGEWEKFVKGKDETFALEVEPEIEMKGMETAETTGNLTVEEEL